MSLDFGAIVRQVQCHLHCTRDEAWDGVCEAYLTLDRTRTEREQYWWLIRVGAWNVIAEIRKRYTPDGNIREVPTDYASFSASEDDTDDYDFLNAFPTELEKEYARYLADGHKCTLDSASNFLRKKFNINRRTATKELYESTRNHAERLR